MASTIVWSRKLPEGARALLLGVWLLFAGYAAAAEIEIANPQLNAVEDGYAVSADFGIDLNARLEEAVTKGVVLHFLVEFELTKPRWYWLDDKLLGRQLNIGLSYHALTRQYRVSTGGLHQSYATLSEALRVLSRLRNWLVVERGAEKPALRAGETYQASLHVKLDISQLPKPFQIAAVGSRDWNYSSEWKTWQLALPVLEAR